MGATGSASAAPGQSQLAGSGSSGGSDNARANVALALGALGVLLGGIALATLLGRRPTRAG